MADEGSAIMAQRSKKKAYSLWVRFLIRAPQVSPILSFSNIYLGRQAVLGKVSLSSISDGSPSQKHSKWSAFWFGELSANFQPCAPIVKIRFSCRKVCEHFLYSKNKFQTNCLEFNLLYNIFQLLF